MAYFVRHERFNGYLCACCIQTWNTDGEWYQDKADALACLQEDGTNPGDFDVIKTEIWDGATGEIIAEGKLEWPPTKYGKYIAHSAQRWFGHREGEPFEVIWTSPTMREKMGTDTPTWDEVLTYLETQDKEQKKAEALRKLEEAQAQLKEME